MYHLLQQLKKYSNSLWPALTWSIASQLTVTLLYTIIVTIVSFLDIKEADFGTTVQDITSQYLLFSLGAIGAFVAFTIHAADRALYRFQQFWSDVPNSVRLRPVQLRDLIRGFTSGMLLPVALLTVLAIGGHVSYLGVYLNTAIGTPSFPLFFLNAFGITALLLAEEYIFRHKILRNLLPRVPSAWACIFVSVFAVFVKHVQFSLQWIELLNVFLLQLAVCIQYIRTQTVHRGFGYMWGTLFFFHCIFGLSIWGLQNPSLVLFKISAKANDWITGGAYGPMSGLGVLSILFVSTAAIFFLRHSADGRGK